jgi:hypothetical protein
MEKKKGRPAKTKAEAIVQADLDSSTSKKKGRPKVRQSDVVMNLPKLSIGEQVEIIFLGQKRLCKIETIESHPINENKWIVSARETTSKRLFSYIGINGSEEYANIYYNEEN